MIHDYVPLTVSEKDIETGVEIGSDSEAVMDQRTSRQSKVPRDRAGCSRVLKEELDCIGQAPATEYTRLQVDTDRFALTFFLRIFQFRDGSFPPKVVADMGHDLLELHGSNHVSKQIDVHILTFWRKTNFP